LTEQNIPLFRNIDDSNATEVRLIIHLLYLKNNADLEAKHFLHYIAENIQDQLPVHDFIAKGMEQN
jgi:hypothetical protein